MNGFDLYEQHFQRPPHVVVEWNDDQTDAAGWLAIDSLRGGAAGGGTRMRPGGTRDEAIMLAKTMGIKFTVAGPGIGGAKTVIRFDAGANPEEKEGVLRRWFRAIAPYLRSHYGTGSDVNTTESEVTHLLADEIGVVHPQEGIVRGHFGDAAAQQAIQQLQDGVALDVNVPGFGQVEAGDLVTGYGTVRALAHYYEAQGTSLAGKRVTLQGFGNVGAAAAHYLAQEGALVVAVTTARSGPDGMEYQFAQAPEGLDVPAELQAPGRERSALDSTRWPWQKESPDGLYDVPADAFIPAAGSDLIEPEHVDRLVAAGVEAVSCAANGPFRGASKGETEVARYADERLAVLVDFIANCGAARLFGYLMQPDPHVADAVATGNVQAFLDDGDQAIAGALAEVFGGEAPKTGLLERAYRVFVPRARPQA